MHHNGEKGFNMDEKYLTLIAKYLSDEIREEERELLFAWINHSPEHQAYFEEMQELWEESGEIEEEPFTTDIDRAWHKVASRMTETPEKTKVRSLNFRSLFRIAAAVALVIVAGTWWFNQTPEETLAFSTNKGEKLEIVLPDSSRVWLNENTSLTYLASFEPRKIQLTGEAFFDVQHLNGDQTFEIFSGETRTLVLGTAFNVRAYPQERQVEVTVERGKVAVESVNKRETKVILTKGESAVYRKDQKVVDQPTETISNANAWKTQRLEFDNENLGEVISVLERYFDTKIEIGDARILNCPFTGAYEKPELSQILEILAYSIDLQIETKNNKTVLFGEGCE